MPIFVQKIRTSAGAGDVYFCFKSATPFSDSAPVYWRAYPGDTLCQTSRRHIRFLDPDAFWEALKSASSPVVPRAARIAVMAVAAIAAVAAVAAVGGAATSAIGIIGVVSAAVMAAVIAAAIVFATGGASRVVTHRQRSTPSGRFAIEFCVGDGWLVVFVVRSIVEDGEVVRKEVFSTIASRVSWSECARAGFNADSTLNTWHVRRADFLSASSGVGPTADDLLIASSFRDERMSDLAALTAEQTHHHAGHLLANKCAWRAAVMAGADHDVDVLGLN